MLDDERTETEIADAKVALQAAALPPAWRAVDRCIVRTTEVLLFGIGALFTVLIALEVFSRYVLGHSFMFVDAGSRFLLVWFFILGAGPALRYGAHVGFELLLARAAPQHRRRIVIATQALGIVFFVEMIWAGLYSLGPAWRQSEPGLEISLGWAFLAVPVGFALMTYHMAVLMAGERRRDARRC